jgi:hypothetical protein
MCPHSDATSRIRFGNRYTTQVPHLEPGAKYANILSFVSSSIGTNSFLLAPMTTYCPSALYATAALPLQSSTATPRMQVELVNRDGTSILTTEVTGRRWNGKMSSTPWKRHCVSCQISWWRANNITAILFPLHQFTLMVKNALPSSIPLCHFGCCSWCKLHNEVFK